MLENRFRVMAHKFMFIKHQSEIQHISPDGLVMENRKKNPSWWVRKEKYIWREIEGKVHKGLKKKKIEGLGPQSRRFSTKTCSTHTASRCRTQLWGPSGQLSLQLCSTMADTRFSYSRLFSWYSWAAWLLAGLLGFGSSSRDWGGESSRR